MKKAAVLAFLGLVSILWADCIVVHPTVGPPPLRAEVVIASPGPGYVWISGYWRWSAGNYVWAAGRWTRAKPGRVWVPGQWKQKGPRWVWQKGRWRSK